MVKWFWGFLVSRPHAPPLWIHQQCIVTCLEFVFFFKKWHSLKFWLHNSCERCFSGFLPLLWERGEVIAPDSGPSWPPIPKSAPDLRLFVLILSEASIGEYLEVTCFHFGSDGGTKAPWRFFKIDDDRLLPQLEVNMKHNAVPKVRKSHFSPETWFLLITSLENK